MFTQQRTRSALLSAFAVLLLLAMSVGAPVAGVSQATISSSAGAFGPAAVPSCKSSTPPVTAFNALNFPTTPKLDNPLYSMTPGTQFIFEGFVNSGSTHQEHQIVTIVTDMTKVINGVHTVVLWDRDLSPNLQGHLEVTESELAFHAQDTAGNPWNLGEYPAVYTGGVFTEAPDTWFAGLPTANGQPAAKAGNILPGNPQVGTPSFLQAYAAPDVILDCGQVSKTGQHICNITGCYDNAVIIEEVSPPDTGSQLKYYAPGVGNFQVDPQGGDPLGETLVLSKTIHLSRDDCLAARQAVLALEDQAYHHDNTQTVYTKTAAMTSTGFCETITPTVTPTASPTTTATPTATATPKPTPPGAPLPGTPRSLYVPVVHKPLPAPAATPTPTPRPEFYDGCKSDPNPAAASNYPVRIVTVDKIAEKVTLENVSNATVLLEDWNLCSINGNQDHDQIGGTIAPHTMRTFPNTGTPGIWNDTQRDDAALYNAVGELVSYWVDQ